MIVKVNSKDIYNSLVNINKKHGINVEDSYHGLRVKAFYEHGLDYPVYIFLLGRYVFIKYKDLNNFDWKLNNYKTFWGGLTKMKPDIKKLCKGLIVLKEKPIKERGFILGYRKCTRDDFAPRSLAGKHNTYATYEILLNLYFYEYIEDAKMEVKINKEENNLQFKYKHFGLPHKPYYYELGVISKLFKKVYDKYFSHKKLNLRNLLGDDLVKSKWFHDKIIKKDYESLTFKLIYKLDLRYKEKHLYYKVKYDNWCPEHSDKVDGFKESQAIKEFITKNYKSIAIEEGIGWKISTNTKSNINWRTGFSDPRTLLENIDHSEELNEIFKEILYEELLTADIRFSAGLFFRILYLKLWGRWNILKQS